jgi:hypothetical protein
LVREIGRTIHTARIESLNVIFIPPRPPLAAPAAPAPCGSPPQRLAAWRGAAWGGLDRRLRMGYGRVSGVYRERGPRDGPSGKAGGERGGSAPWATTLDCYWQNHLHDRPFPPKVSSTTSVYLGNRKLFVQRIDNKSQQWFPKEETLRKLDDIPGDAKTDPGNHEISQRFPAL